jgi:hypothetical protein
MGRARGDAVTASSPCSSSIVTKDTAPAVPSGGRCSNRSKMRQMFGCVTFAGELDLAPEALVRPLVDRDLGSDRLQRDPLTKRQVLGLVQARPFPPRAMNRTTRNRSPQQSPARNVATYSALIGVASGLRWAAWGQGSRGDSIKWNYIIQASHARGTSVCGQRGACRASDSATSRKTTARREGVTGLGAQPAGRPGSSSCRGSTPRP